MTRFSRLRHWLTPKKSWFRFSTRSLLIAFTVASLLIGLVSTRWYRNYRHDLAVTAVKQASGQVVENGEGGVERVYVASTDFDDEALAALAPHLYYLRGLKELDLVYTPVTYDGVRSLYGLAELEELYLFETKVSDEEIARIRKELPHVAVKLEEPDPVATKLAATNIYRHAIVALAVDDNRPRLVTGSGDGTLRWWTLPSLALPASHQAHAKWLFAATFSPDGELLATGGGDQLIKIWSTTSRELLATLAVHEDDVHALAFSSDGQTLYSAGDDMTLRSWNVTTRSSPREIGEHDEQIPTIAVNPVTGVVASGSRDDTIRLWDPNKGLLLRTLDGHEGDVMALAFSPDGQTLASAGYDQTVRLWNAESGEPMGQLEGHSDRVYAVAFSPDGRTIASGGGDGVIAWETGNRSVRFRYEKAKQVACVKFTGDGNSLLLADANGYVYALDARRGILLRRTATDRAHLALIGQSER